MGSPGIKFQNTSQHTSQCRVVFTYADKLAALKNSFIVEDNLKAVCCQWSYFKESSL